MFRTLVISKKKRRSGWSWLLVVMSLTVHGGLLGYFCLNDFLGIPWINPPSVTVSLISASSWYIKPPPSQPVGIYIPAEKRRESVARDDLRFIKPERIIVPTEIPDELKNAENDFNAAYEEAAMGEWLGNGDDGWIPGGEGYPDPKYRVPKNILVGNDPFRPMGKGIQKPRKIMGPNPRYPGIAEGAGIPCSVKIEAKIDVDGRVVDIIFLQSCPLFEEEFNNAVLTAVRQWKFAPATLDGIPVPVRYNLIIRFEL